VENPLCNGRLDHALNLQAHFPAKPFAICEKIPHCTGRCRLILADDMTHEPESVRWAWMRVIFGSRTSTASATKARRISSSSSSSRNARRIALYCGLLRFLYGSVLHRTPTVTEPLCELECVWVATFWQEFLFYPAPIRLPLALKSQKNHHPTRCLLHIFVIFSAEGKLHTEKSIQ
jgi:hypothetical protein